MTFCSHSFKRIYNHHPGSSVPIAVSLCDWMYTGISLRCYTPRQSTTTPPAHTRMRVSQLYTRACLPRASAHVYYHEYERSAKGFCNLRPLKSNVACGTYMYIVRRELHTRLRPPINTKHSLNTEILSPRRLRIHTSSNVYATKYVPHQTCRSGINVSNKHLTQIFSGHN